MSLHMAWSPRTPPTGGTAKVGTQPPIKCFVVQSLPGHVPPAAEALREGPFTVANYNVLYAKSNTQQWVTASKIRFQHQAEVLFPSLVALSPSADRRGGAAPVHVIGFNEACPLFEAALLSPAAASRFPPGTTYLTQQNGHKHFSSLLSTLPVDEIYSVGMPPGRNALCALVRVPSANSTSQSAGSHFIVCTAHTEAYEEGAMTRRAQLTHLLDQIPRLSSSKSFQECVQRRQIIIMGDLNLHLLGENSLLPSLGMVDCWRHLHGPENNGFTWEGGNAWWLPFDTRKMRLDRIAVQDGCEGYTPTAMSIFAKDPIPGDTLFHPRIFPSDHFGLRLSLERVEEVEGRAVPFQGNAHVPTERELVRGSETGGRSIAQIKAMVVVGLLTALGVPLWLLVRL